MLVEWLGALNDLNAFDDWQMVTVRHHLPLRSAFAGFSAEGPVRALVRHLTEI